MAVACRGWIQCMSTVYVRLLTDTCVCCRSEVRIIEDKVECWVCRCQIAN